MLEKLLLNLQMFAEGGDGGSAGGEGTENAEGKTSGEEIPSVIPERAREFYKRAVEKNQSKTVPVQTATEQEVTQEQEGGRKSYAELIKSDEYREEHKAYMDKTIGDRLKRYKGIEAQNNQMLGLLETVANKYGVDAQSKTFLEDLTKRIEEDDSYYEEYASTHDVTPGEARKIVTMERKLQNIERERQEQEQQEAMRHHVMVLRQNAEKTKLQFPEFDLDSEMKDERFRKLCAVNNGDTTAAYMACHWDTLVQGMVQAASQQIAAQTAQTVAANKARPSENGISGSASTVIEQDFRNMSLEQLRAYAAEQRKKQRGN